MSQFYPQQPPSYPPQGPPEEYYYEEGDYEYDEYEDDEDGSQSSIIQYALAFVAGGCLIFLCMSCCLLLAGGLWMADAAMVATPVPGSDIGLSYDDPAFMNETVVNDQLAALTVFQVDRNAALPTVPPVEGRELIIVTLELENLNTDKDVKYSERDFLLLNNREEAYAPTPGATVIEGALDRGSLGPEEGLQGRLVYEVLAGEPVLTLAWEDTESTARYVLLQ